MVIAGLVVVAIELGFPDLVGDGGALRGGPGGGIGASGFEDDPGALRPKRVEVSVSGDLLVRSPVWQRALALGGGSSYDFRPMMHPIKPFVAGADLAICHLETTLTRGEPQGFPLQDGLIALLDVVIDGDGDRVRRIRYVPIWVRHPDFAVLPVGRAVREGDGDRASLGASYERTVELAGRDPRVVPLPKRLP